MRITSCECAPDSLAEKLTSTHNCLLRRRAKGKRRFLGAPQTPSGELRPLHPLLKRRFLGAPQTPSGELRPLHPLLKRRFLGALRGGAPQTPSGELRPLHPLLTLNIRVC